VTVTCGGGGAVVVAALVVVGVGGAAVVVGGAAVVVVVLRVGIVRVCVDRVAVTAVPMAEPLPPPQPTSKTAVTALRIAAA
jgi:hypothetical protein